MAPAKGSDLPVRALAAAALAVGLLAMATGVATAAPAHGLPPAAPVAAALR